MKKLSFAIALLGLATAGAAMAADLPVKAPFYKAPILIDPWTGFYVGGNLGYSAARWDSANPPGAGPNFPTGTGVIGTGLTNVASPNVKGWVAGAQAGYNWQRGRWVFGLEGDVQGTGERASQDGGDAAAIFIPFVQVGGGIASDPGCRVAGCTLTVVNTLTNSWKLPWFATFRGRVGTTMMDPTLLLYVTGGLAVAATEYGNTNSITATVTSNATGAVIAAATAATAASERKTRAGIAVGAWFEKALDKHWSVKAEYLYLDFGTQTFLAGTGADTSVRLRDHIVRVGANFHLPPM